MVILVISDLHIDTGDNFGTFRWAEDEFINQVEQIRYLYSVDKIICNGDTFELLKYSLPNIMKAYPRIREYFRDKDFIFINGNHDIVNPDGIPHYQITNSQGQVIHIEHGHQADWFNGSRIGRSISRFTLKLLKRFSRFRPVLNLYFRIVAFEEQLNRIPKRFNTVKYMIYAMKLLRRYDVVILGHTHKLESHHTYYLNRKKRYLNCGSCSFGRFEGIILNTETLRYEFLKPDREIISLSAQAPARTPHTPQIAVR